MFNPSNILLSFNKSRIDKTCFKISDSEFKKIFLDDNESISSDEFFLQCHLK